MAKPLIVTMKLACWFRFYVLGLVVFSAITGTKPNPDKVEYWIKKALTITTSGDKEPTTNNPNAND